MKAYKWMTKKKNKERERDRRRVREKEEVIFPINITVFRSGRDLKANTIYDNLDENNTNK